MNNKFIDELIVRYPSLMNNYESIENSCKLLIECFSSGGKLLCCGNGGSSADCDHIVGELMKGFLKQRKLNKIEKNKFSDEFLANGLQNGLPALSLTSQSSVITAFSNDCEPALIFAQQVYSLGNKGDVLIALSTSGNSENVVYALKTAKSKELKTISITGKHGGECKKYSDLCIALPETQTYKIQELTLPVYHCICATIEDYFYKE